MCHVYLSLNPQPKGFRTQSWVGRYQPLVWEQSEASGSRKLLLPYCFLVDRRIPNNVWHFPAPSRMNYSSINHVSSSPEKKKWSFPQSHQGDGSCFCKYCKHPWCLFKKALSSATDQKTPLWGCPQQQGFSSFVRQYFPAGSIRRAKPMYLLFNNYRKDKV